MDKLEKLKKVMELLKEDTINPTQLASVMATVIKAVNDAKSDIKNLSEENVKYIQEALSYIDVEHSKLLQSVSQETDSLKENINEQIVKLKDLIKEVKAIEVKDGKDGLDGINPDPSEVVPLVLEKLPKVEELSGEKIVDKINDLDLTPENQIDFSHIKNAPQWKGGKSGGVVARNIYQMGDVSLTNLADGEVLVWDDTNKLWVNDTAVGGASAFIDLTDVPSAYTGEAGKVVAVNGTEDGLEFIEATSTDEKVKYDAGDPTAGYVADKIIAGTGITVAEGAGGDANKLVITSSITQATRDSLGLDTDDTVTFANLSGTNTGDQDLSGLVPYTGATADLDLGVNTLYLGTTTGQGANIIGRDVTTTNGDGGTFAIYSSAGDGSGKGGDFELNAGNGGVTGNGGSFLITPGAGQGGGVNGAVIIYDPTSNQGAIFDTSALATTDKTFTFPNTSGTIALTSDIPTVPDNLTDFTGQTAWRVFYSNTDGDVTELALGADGTFLKSNGATSAPSFAVPAGSGDVSKVGTPVNNQIAIWTGDGTIEGDASLTWDGTSFNIATAKNFQIAGATILADAAGTTTLSNIDAIDATTEATIEGAIDTLPNLASVAGTSGTIAFNGANITDLGDVTFKTGVNGGTLRTGTSAADKFVLQAYDVNDTTYRTVIELDAGNTPVLQLRANFLEIDDNTDQTKRVTWDVSGATASTATILDFNQSANRTITFPDATGTVALTSNITGTNSGTNTGDQTITNSSDATSHTVTLSASGGSLQLIEGTNITLTTGGTGSAGTITIAASGGSGDVTKVGTPVDNQVGVWTGNGTLEGDAAFTFDTTANTLFLDGTIELGHATDTTLARSSAGNVSIEGNVIYRAGGTDVALADGGTGTSMSDPGEDRLMLWDDSQGMVVFANLGDYETNASPAAGDYFLMVDNTGPTQKVNYSVFTDTFAPKASPTFTGTVILPKTIEIQDTTGDHQYVLAVSELAADRTVTLPLLTGADEFVFKDHAVTLTNKTIALGSNTVSGTKAQFDTAVSDGNIMFDGDSITNATATAWRVFYSDGSGVITELALGADGTFLKSNGAAVAPTFATPAGSGDVSKVGTPVNNQIGVWTGDGTLEGDADLTFDSTTLALAGAQTITVADTANIVGLTINQNDVTNDNNALRLVASNSGYSGDLLSMEQAFNGPTAEFYFNTATPDDFDTIGVFKFSGKDSGASKSTYGDFGMVASDVTATEEDSYYYFRNVVAGSLVTQLEIGNGVNGISLGSGSAAGVVESNGNQDLTLQTGNATTGSITIVDGANGAINLTPNGSGVVAVSTDLTVADEAYGAGWNGSLEVPTKNALYDKIETISGSGIAEELAIAYAVAL